MRLFIAFDVPTDVSDELRRVQGELPRQGLSLSRDFHCTLKFLGEVDEKKAALVAERLKAVKSSSIEASLAQVGFFSLNESPRVVWMGVDPKGEIEALQKKVDDSLAGLFPREKSFVPHLTLGRMREALDKESLKAFSKTRVKHIKFSVNSFALVKSTLTPSGAVHEKVAIYGLEQ